MARKQQTKFCSVIFREIFFDEKTGDVYKLGDKIKRPVLANTLEKIANSSADEFYIGETAKLLVEDAQSYGAIISEEDLKEYK
jgi:gamma-glutamyltranspeptidase